LLRELRDRNIDLAIGTSIAPISDENMESELLFRDRLVIVAGASSKWAGRRKIKPDELLGEPWTFPPAGSTRQRFQVRWPCVSPPNRPY
jgi:DNA-binding transcriptional LysR family regulator